MRVLITAGPTREYIDDVRFLSNASSGQMGYALAASACDAGYDVLLITGPVMLTPPLGCEVLHIETTSELQAACLEHFPACDGIIATAAVCDYRPRERIRGKITKTGAPVQLDLIETADVLRELGEQKGSRWIVGFALESQDPRSNALRKLKLKNCDVIAVNDTSAIGATHSQLELLDPEGHTVAQLEGDKPSIAADLIAWIDAKFGQSTSSA